MLPVSSINQIAPSLVSRLLLITFFSAALCLLGVADASAQFAADFSVTKTASATTVTADSNITYTIIVTNNGPNTAGSLTARLLDTIPTNTTFQSIVQDNGPMFSCSVPPANLTDTVNCILTASFGPQQTAQFTLIVKVNSTTAAGTEISNTAVVQYSSELNITNNQSTATTTVGSATAASVSVSGRVLTRQGRGIRNVIVRLVDEQGQHKITTTTSFGYFRFADVPAGQTYTISVSGKKYSFTQPARVLNLTGDADEINFVADN